tara:strand:+ start:2170 stop:2670 length:501 start_codon:yes stop_codon:yes gene_type:complete
MNIFVTDECPKKSAQEQCDKHVVKMILESAQMLSTAWRVYDDEYSEKHGLYKQAYLNHPCTVWTREAPENYVWLCTHFDQLCKEYSARYLKFHRSEKLKHGLWNIPFPIKRLKNIPDNPKTFALAMPDEYKTENVYDSYRNYLVNEKSHFAKWDKIPSRKPTWWNN